MTTVVITDSSLRLRARVAIDSGIVEDQVKSSDQEIEWLDRIDFR